MFPISNGVNKIYSQFILECPIKVVQDKKLAQFCTMKVGGPADLWVEARTRDELVEVLKLVHKLGIKYFVLAGGSNVVFPDKGFKGIVVKVWCDRIKIGSGEKLVEVEAGAMLGEMVRSLLKQGWGGFNFLANIPGSVGGAIVGNAGCYGKEIKDYLQEIEVFNVKTGKITIMKPSELEFAYRHSKLKHQPELIVLSAIFKLEEVNRKQALKEIAVEKQLRRDKHPQSPSCGSWFKNPSRSEPAWKFIEAVGMKGATVGGAKISNKHANFLINYHHATAADIIKLAKLVQRKVKSVTGIILDEEVKVIR